MTKKRSGSRQTSRRAPNALDVEVGARLLQLRAALGLSAERAAGILKYAPNRQGKGVWSAIEGGHRGLAPERALILCDLFSLTTDWLYRGKTDGLRADLQEKLKQGAKRIADASAAGEHWQAPRSKPTRRPRKRAPLQQRRQRRI